MPSSRSASARRSAVLVLLACLIAPVAAQEPAPAPASAVSGIVHRPDGTPAPDVAVLVLVGPEGAGALPQVSSASTDAGGRFSVPVPPGRFVTVRLSAAGFATVFLPFPVAPPPLDVTLAPGVAVEGGVSDEETARPIAGAEVVAVPAGWQLNDALFVGRFAVRTRTGRDGRFRLADLPRGPVTIEVRAPGRQWVAREAVPAEPAAVLPWLYLGPGGGLSGKVLGPDGTPRPWARVVARPVGSAAFAAFDRARAAGARFDTVFTAPDGTFELQGLPAGLEVLLVAETKGAAPAVSDPVSAGTSRGPLVLRCPAHGSVTGQLRSQGRPVSGKAVLRFDAGPLRLSASTAAVDAEGGFVVRDVSPGTGQLQVVVPGFRVVSRPLSVRENETTAAGVIELEAAPSLGGRVVDADGAPVEGAQVTVRGTGNGSGVSDGGGETDAEGRFRTGELTPGLSYTITARHRAKGFAARQGVALDDDVTVVLEPAGAVTGRVLAGDPPRPAPHFTVALEPADGDDDPRSIVQRLSSGPAPVRGVDGVFSARGLAPGRWAAVVDVPGCVPLRAGPLEVAAGATVDAGELRAMRGVRLRVRVVDRKTQAPLAGARVTIEQPGTEALLRRAMARQALPPTAPDGTVVLEGLAPGRVTIAATHAAFAPARKDVDLDGLLPEADATLELGPGGAIEGVVRAKDGGSAAGHQVHVVGTRGVSERASTRVDENGTFRLEHLAPGPYNLVVMPLRGAETKAVEVFGETQMASVTVEEGRTTAVRLPAGNGAAAIAARGTVRRNGAPVAARLFWLPERAASLADLVTATTGPDGRYDVQLKASGRYEVRAVPLDATEFSVGFGVTVEVPGGRAVFEQDIVAPAGVITGRVLDERTAQPLKGVRVTAHRVGEDGQEGPVAGFALSGDDGVYRVDALPAGRYRLTGLGAGHAAVVTEPFDLDDEAARDLLLGPSVPLRVRVVDGQGNPVAGATVGARETRLAADASETREDGTVVLKQLGPGTYELFIVAAGWAPVARRAVTLTPGGPAEDVEIALHRGGAVRLAVVSSAGAPVGDLVVRLFDASGGELSTLVNGGTAARTDSAGIAHVEALEGGAYDVQLFRGDTRVARRKVTVVEGKTVSEEVKVE